MNAIAIVGYAGRFPGSGDDLTAFWRNVAAAADCSTPVPPGRWLLPPDRCHDPRVPHPDAVYSTRGYYLDPFHFDPAGTGLSADLLDRLDPLFHLILDVGVRAWRAAKTARADKRKAGVILGNICLPTDAASALARRYLLGEESPAHPLNRYVAGLPAGLLAQVLGLGLGTFTLDAACASTLYAIKLACDELESGRADVMLAGGVNRSDCLYTQMGFAQLRALSVSGRCSPFDAAADGLMVGEGAGVFVLKRLDDAVRDDDTIHGVIRGWGLSNDVSGNLLAPAKEGQLRAMRTAYAAAGWKPSDVDLIECHATGTAVGDAVEFDSLSELWGSERTPRPCTIGSVKSTVGHLLTGAGAAALAKVLLAMANRTLPPQANFRTAGPNLNFAAGPFRVLGTADAWERRAADVPRRAAVSGFGFGGVNAHLLIEEYVPGRPVTVRASGVPTPVPVEDDIAVVGLGAHVGSWASATDLGRFLVGGAARSPERKRNGWGDAMEACPPGHFIEELAVPLDRFRIPPTELKELLPQQLLMLQVAATALDDAGMKPSAADVRTGVFVGLGLDLNTTNFHLRWHGLTKAHPHPQALFTGGEGSLEPLTADRTMGALGSITASRIARAFGFGGPSFTCCSEETSAATAVQLAVRALRLGEIDRAVCGGVDLTGDPRQLLATADARPVSPDGLSRPLDRSSQGFLPAEGAAALVFKRLADAERDGDRVYAVIRGVGSASGGEPASASTDASAYASSFVAACRDAGVDPSSIELLEAAASGASADDRAEGMAIDALLAAAPRPHPLVVGGTRGLVGHTGAASAAVALLRACLALRHRLLPPGVRGNRLTDEAVSAVRAPRYWLTDDDQPRRAAVAAVGADGSCLHLVVEEYVKADAAGVSSLLPRPNALLIVDGNTPHELLVGLTRLDDLIEDIEGGLEALARVWVGTHPPSAARKLAVTFVASSLADLREQVAYAAGHLRTHPTEPLQVDLRASVRDRVFYSPSPVGQRGRLAFVYPGSGNQFAGMGRDLGVHFPHVLHRQQAENRRLRRQYAPDLFWGKAIPPAAAAKQFLFGQVTLGTLVSDTLVSLGLQPDAMLGLSLGESAGLFGLRVWTSRDEMLGRIEASDLFGPDLGPPYRSARRHWDIPPDADFDWLTGVIAASPDDVRSRIRPGLRVFLLIANTPTECVIGGERRDVASFAEGLGKAFHPLTGVTLAHCPAGKPVEREYRELHTLPVTAPAGLKVYSGAWARAYALTEANAAESITAGLVNSLDFPAVVEAAYREGVRGFVEIGPGASCTRMIAGILGDRPHLVRAACVPKADAATQVLKTVAAVVAERFPVDTSRLYAADEVVTVRKPAGPMLVVPVGRPSKRVGPKDSTVVLLPPVVVPAVAAMEVETPLPKVVPAAAPVVVAPNWLDPFIEATTQTQSATADAHEVFLRLQTGFVQLASHTVEVQNQLLRQMVSAPVADAPDSPPPPPPVALTPGSPVPRSLTFEQCSEYAVGKIGAVLGPLFAEIDTYPTRVRLPEGPLMLVDRILLIEGEPKSLTSGRVVTDHTVRVDRWYLDNGRCPTSVTVESGQADLFLSGFLGIDFVTRGKAVYRLLDAVVTFHRDLPRVGERIEYDIRIDEFFRQGDSWLFRFRFEGSIDGRPLLSMANGVAGFFTADALAAGQGIVHTKLDKQPMPGVKPADWQPLVAFDTPTSLDAAGVAALHRGDLAAAFGDTFAHLPLKQPLRLPGGMLKLVNRVPLLDPTGGRFGLGFVRAEYDIRPKEWFIECHFVDDKVMPGTLMYECCLHTLRTLLMRMGWVGEDDRVMCEPVPGVQSRLKCRGQVLDTTKLVTYEVSIKELGFRPEPYCIADALMSADGKPVVEITNLSLRMSGLTLASLRGVWGSGFGVSEATGSPTETLPTRPEARFESGIAQTSVRPNTPYPKPRILAYSNGNPSEAFGEPYRVFDRDRVLARLPGPPYQFLDRVVSVTGEPFVLKEGAACTAEYDVPPGEWYFDANRGPIMPFSVLLEIALQPCGWLAAYCGSALTSGTDLSFRNLGGKATQLAAVGPDIGTLTARATMTKVSKSAGMIIQNFDVRVSAGDRVVYEGDTYFGFFAKDALRNQVGMPQAQVPYLTDEQKAVAESGHLPHDPPFPAPMLRMVDVIDGYLPRGGKKGLGLIQGRIAVDPTFWFFNAHFYQDPVWPGSLGLESFLQLLKYVAWKRWKTAPANGWQAVGVGAPHQWTYRGQVVPTDKEVTVVLEVTDVNDANRRLMADGFLTVDGRIIYQMTDFTLE